MRGWYASYWNAILCYEFTVADPGFPLRGVLTLRGDANIRFCQNFTKNCMKLKEFMPPGGDARPKFYYVDPPLI